MAEQAAERKVLRVVRGDPSPEELAALVAVLTARRPTTPRRAIPQRSGWADRAAALRQPLRPGPGAWRAGGRSAGTRTRAGT